MRYWPILNASECSVTRALQTGRETSDALDAAGNNKKGATHGFT
jgi:hypothetical protein